MPDGTKTVNDMPKPDQITAKKIGTNSVEPLGPVGKGSLENMKMDKTFSPSATPKSGPGQAVAQSETKDAVKPQAQGAKGGGMGTK